MYFSALWCHQPKNIITLDSRGHRHWLEAFRETHGCHLQIYPNILFSNTLTIQVIHWKLLFILKYSFFAWMPGLQHDWHKHLQVLEEEEEFEATGISQHAVFCLSSTWTDGSPGGPSQDESTAWQTLLTNDKRKFGFKSCFKWLLDNDPNLF